MKIKLTSLFLSHITRMCGLCLAFGSIHADNIYSFIGKDPKDPNNFFVANNWSGGPSGTVPGADDTAIIGHRDAIDAPYTAFGVVALGAVSVKNLTIAHTSMLNFTILNVSGILNLGDLPGTQAGLICVASPGTLKNTGTMNVNNAPGKGATLSGNCIFENFGTLNLGGLLVSGGMIFNNMSTGIVSMGDGFLGSVGTAFMFNNMGYLRKPSRSGIATVNEVAFVHTGVVEVGAGSLIIGGTDSLLISNGGQFRTLTPAAVIEYASPWTINDGTRFIGPGLHLCVGSMELHGNVTIGFRDPTSQLVAPGKFELAGTIGGPGNLQVIANGSNSSEFNWTAGTLHGVGALNIDTGGFFNISGSSASGFDSKILSERTVNNSGTTTWSGASDVLAGASAGATFNNLAGATFEIRNNRSFSGGGGGVFNNRPGATLRKITGTQVTVFNLVFNNDGLEDVQTGILQLTSGGVSSGTFNAGASAGTAFTGGSSIYTMKAGSAFTGDGQVVGGNATVTLNAAVPAVNYSLLLGTLDGPGDLNISHDFDMGLDSVGCTLAGSGALNIAPLATFNLTGSQRKTVIQRQINNAGTAVWVGVGNIVMSQGATFNNRMGASFYANNNASFQSGGGAIPQFLNAGAFIKSTGTGTTTFDGPAFINTGLISALSGTLDFHFPDFTQTAGGVIDLNGGIIKSKNNPLGIQGGTLQGTGTVIGNVNNSGGIFSPGHSPGTITETGNYAQGTGGTLKVEINGPTAGTDYDQLKVIGTVALSGALKVFSGITPPSGATFLIIDNDGADAVSGTFIGLPEGALLIVGGNAFAITYHGGDGNDVALNATVVKVGSVSKTGDAITVAIAGFTGRRYQLQRSLDLSPRSFINVGAVQTGDSGAILSLVDNNATSPTSFYRVKID